MGYIISTIAKIPHRLLSLVARSLKSSFRQHCYGKSACIFHESTDNREGMPGHGASDATSHCDFSICPFLSRDFVHLFAGSKFAAVSHSYRVQNATGTAVLINGKSTGHYIQRHKSKHRDRRSSNKALYNSGLSYPRRLSMRNDEHTGKISCTLLPH